MKNKILILGLLLFVIGCRTTDIKTDYSVAKYPIQSAVWAEFAGAGDTILSPQVTSSFRNSYVDIPFGKMFFLRKDGQRAVTIECDVVGDDCLISKRDFSQARRECIGKSNQRCRVFAIGNKIVWNGNIAYSDVDISKTEPTDSAHEVKKIRTVRGMTGKGPLKISQTVNAYIKAYYEKLEAPAFLIVSANGNAASAVVCDPGAIACGVSSSDFRLAHETCERDPSNDCFIHSKGHERVWQGTVVNKSGRDLTKAFERAMKENDLHDSRVTRISVHNTIINYYRSRRVYISNF